MQPLTPPLARRYKDVLDQLATLEQAMHEENKPLVTDELCRSALEFLILYTEYAAAHRDADPTGEWQTFLVDFVHAFTYNDHEGVVHNALEEMDLDGVVLECCALDEDDARTIEQRLSALRETLLAKRVEVDDFKFY